jgi:uncharacterized membrane protein
MIIRCVYVCYTDRKEKWDKILIKNKKYLYILFSGVKALRRALGYFTIITCYSCNGYPIFL